MGRELMEGSSTRRPLVLTPKGLHVEHEPDLVLLSSGGKGIKPGWSGYRVGVGISLNEF